MIVRRAGRSSIVEGWGRGLNEDPDRALCRLTFRGESPLLTDHRRGPKAGRGMGGAPGAMLPVSRVPHPQKGGAAPSFQETLNVRF